MKIKSELVKEKRYLNDLMKNTSDEKTQKDIFRKLSKINTDIKIWEKRGF